MIFAYKFKHVLLTITNAFIVVNQIHLVTLWLHKIWYSEPGSVGWNISRSSLLCFLCWASLWSRSRLKMDQNSIIWQSYTNFCVSVFKRTSLWHVTVLLSCWPWDFTKVTVSKNMIIQLNHAFLYFPDGIIYTSVLTCIILRGKPFNYLKVARYPFSCIISTKTQKISSYSKLY